MQTKKEDIHSYFESLPDEPSDGKQDIHSYFESLPENGEEDYQSDAFKKIKKRFPGMPEGLIKLMMPTATKMAESDFTPPQGGNEAFARSFFRTPLEMAENLAGKAGLPTVKDADWPSAIAEEKKDYQHPFAQLGGGILGSALLGGPTIGAARAGIPAWGAIASRAAPSMLRRSAIYGTEGAGLGAAYGPGKNKEDIIRDVMQGGLLGALLGGPGVSIAKSVPKLFQRGKGASYIDQLQKQHDETLNSFKQKEAQETDFKKYLHKNYGSDTPEGLIRKAQVAQEKINQLSQSAAKEPIQTENLLNHPTRENLLTDAQGLRNAATRGIEQESNILSQQLGQNLRHDIRYQNELRSGLESNRQEIGNLFNQNRNELQGHHVNQPQTRTAQQISHELSNVIRDGGLHSEEATALADELHSLERSRRVPADQFYTAMRSARQEARRYQERAHEIGSGTDEQRQNWLHTARRLNQLADSMEPVIEGIPGIGQRTLNRMRSANERYRNERVPLHNTPEYWQIMGQQGLPSNFINKLGGAHPGLQILSNMSRQNPSLARNLLGQRYAHQPHEMVNANEFEQSFINELPSIQNGVNRIRQHQSQLQSAQRQEEAAQQVMQRAKEARDRVEEAFKEEHKAEMVRREMESLKKQQKTYEQQAKEAQKILDNKKLSYDIHLKAASDLKNAQDDIGKLNKHLLSLGKYLATIGLTAAGVSVINRR